MVLVVRNLPSNAGDSGLILWSGRSPGGGHGNPLQYSCLKNSHGQSSLAGYSPWGCKELDTTEATYCAHTNTHTNTQSVRQANTYERLSERTGVITWGIRNWQPSCISHSEIQVNESYDLLWLIFHLIKSCRYRDDVLFISAFPSKIKMVNEHLIRGWMCGWVNQWRIFWGMICLEAHGNTPLLRAGDWDWHIYTIDTM